MKARARGAPVAVQLAVLLIISLFAAQAIGIAVAMIARPPAYSVYGMEEIADALQGRNLEPSLGRPLIRTIAKRPPPDVHDASLPPSEGYRQSLAALLSLPPDAVRLQRVRSPLIVRIISGRSTATPRPDTRPRTHGAGVLEGSGRLERLNGVYSEVLGPFVAAARQPDGRWVVVRPRHAPFPNSWQRRVALWLLGCLLLVIPASYLFARRITAPIDRFANAAEALGRDPKAAPLVEAGPAEISKAANAFNEMHARIRRYVDDRTAMFGAISHDLRTPLARIRYKLEQGPDGLRDSVLKDVEQMEEMIGAVLTFIRDASEPRTRERLDLLSLVECVVDDAALAGEKVELAEGPGVSVDGDALALQRMLSNLIDNAVKHAGGARVRIAPADPEVLVEIEDDGPGLPEDEIVKVFEPFYRATRDEDHGGMGLGLSVARSIARAHGGEVELSARPGGLTATVRLPRAG